jgi:hypothetical protein
MTGVYPSLGVSICLNVLSIETLDLDSSKTDISTVKKFLTLQKPTSRPHICTQGGGEGVMKQHHPQGKVLKNFLIKMQ